MIKKLVVEQIEDSIKTLINKFQECPRYFFSEFDITSYLYHLLISKDKLKQEYITNTGYSIGIIHTEYIANSGRFDLVVLDPKYVNKLPITKQRILCGIEIGLNRSYAHFEKDYSQKFVQEARNEVSFGYILHFVKGSNLDWEKVVYEVEEATKNKDCSLIEKIDTVEAKALAIRIDVIK